MILKTNFYVITGGPGVGKTSLINELQQRGYRCIPEVARVIIKEQMEQGGIALPWKDTEHYSRLMLERSVDSFISLSQNDGGGICFFDRGIPDTYGYNRLINLPIGKELQYAAEEYRYNPLVFILPPWEEIYTTDNERKQSLQEAIDTYEVMKTTY